MPIRLAIVDDYEVVVRGLAEMLRPHAHDLEVVSVSATPLDREVDIALIDPSARTYDRADRPGLDALLADPRVGKVVVYSWSTDRAQAEDALQRGVAACLSKTISAADLVEALRKVHAGERVASVVAETPAPSPTGVTWPGREEGLTAREAEVIALITQGLSNQEIAERATLSINSVKSYIRTSYRKMGVTSRTNAVLWGLDHGFSPERVRAE
jgi:DNA-binding NarL/FixJ family response regulator